MADTTLKFLLLGEDRSASKALKGVGDTAGKTGGKLSKVGGGLGMLKGGLIGMAASLTVGALTDFGGAAVDAFRDAEKSQRALEDAYSRFPAVADVNIEAMRKMNQEIQNKTGADADDLAASQAVLARYKMTGTQIKDMTPLLVDYAKRTGKDLPAASGVLGKAMMGSGRAMKELGIKFKDTGDPAKNLEQIMGGLRKTVGGYAEKEATSAAGKTEIMRARMGDLQEGIGQKLEPVMSKLLDTGMAMLDWLDANPQVIAAMSAAFDGLVIAIEFVGSIIGTFLKVYVGGLARGIAAITGKAADMLEALSTVPGFGWAKDAAARLRQVSKGAEETARSIDSIGKKKPDVKTGTAMSNVVALKRNIASIKGKIVTAKANGDSRAVDALKAKLGTLRRQYTVAVRVIKTGIRGITMSGSLSSTGRMQISAYARGGSYRPGEMALVGERGPELVHMPDTAGRVLTSEQTRRALGGAGGGDSIVIMVQGDSDPDAAARRIETKLTKLRARKGRLNFEARS